MVVSFASGCDDVAFCLVAAKLVNPSSGSGVWAEVRPRSGGVGAPRVHERATGVGGAGRSLPFIAPPRSAAIPKKNRKRSRLGNRAARFTSRKVLDVVGEPHLRLIAGKGHWHFVYHDIMAGIYDTRSIYAMRLSDLSFGRGGARLRRLRQHQVEVKLRTTAIAADLLAATAAQANDYSLVIACYNSTISVESALDSYNRCLGSINGCSRQWRVLSWAQTTLIVSLSQQ